MRGQYVFGNPTRVRKGKKNPVKYDFQQVRLVGGKRGKETEKGPKSTTGWFPADEEIKQAGRASKAYARKARSLKHRKGKKALMAKSKKFGLVRDEWIMMKKAAKADMKRAYHEVSKQPGLRLKRKFTYKPHPMSSLGKGAAVAKKAKKSKKAKTARKSKGKSKVSAKVLANLAKGRAIRAANLKKGKKGKKSTKKAKSSHKAKGSRKLSKKHLAAMLAGRKKAAKAHAPKRAKSRKTSGGKRAKSRASKKHHVSHFQHQLYSKSAGRNVGVSVKVNPKRRHMKRRKNPMSMTAPAKVNFPLVGSVDLTGTYPLVEAGSLVLGGLIYSWTNKKFAPMLSRIPVVGTYMSAFGGTIAPLTAGIVISTLISRFTAAGSQGRKFGHMLSDGLIGAALVGAGVSLAKSAGMAGVSFGPERSLDFGSRPYDMGSVSYTPELSGVDFTAGLLNAPAASNNAANFGEYQQEASDFGIIPSGLMGDSSNQLG